MVVFVYSFSLATPSQLTEPLGFLVGVKGRGDADVTVSEVAGGCLIYSYIALRSRISMMYSELFEAEKLNKRVLQTLLLR